MPASSHARPRGACAPSAHALSAHAPRARRLRLETLEDRRLLSVYYVDPAGSDLQSGASAAPWKTLQHAVAAIAPGDTIRVRSGTYAGCRIESSGLPGQPSTLMADDGATVRITSPGPKNRHQSGVEVENFDHDVNDWLLDGLEASGLPRYGIDLRHANRVTVRNCIAHDNAVTGIFLAFSDRPLLEGNESYSNGEHGIYHSNSGDHPTIRGNRMHHNAGSGLHMNGDVSQGGDGLISDALIENNVVHDNGQLGGSGINCDGVADSLLQNNLIYAERASGLSLYQIDAASGSANNRVINNTILTSSTGRWALNISDSPGAVVRNNILISEHASRGAITIDAASLVGFDSDYNACLNRFTTDDNATRLTLSQWRAATGQDQHSIAVSPTELFVDAAVRDYRLAQGSAALDRGVLAGAPAFDLVGLARPQGSGVDLGAYERMATRPEWIVLNALNAGAGSLRQAILDANAAPGPDAIRFQLPAGKTIISLATPLPLVTGEVTLQVPAGLTVQVGDGDRFDLRSSGGLGLAGGGILALDGGRLWTKGLNIDAAAGTALDLADGLLVLDYLGGASPLAQITDYLATGINLAGTTWDGAGIMSRVARDDASFTTSLGLIDNSAVGYNTISGHHFGNDLPGGEPLPAEAVLVKFTYTGDSDLNGRVDGDDLVSMLVGYANGLHAWDTGEFDYSGATDGDDLVSLLYGYSNQGAPLADAALRTPPQ